MSEHFDPFEAELAALKPEQPSPRLQQRIADQLQSEPKQPASPLLTSMWRRVAQRTLANTTVRYAVVAGLAACALAAFVLWPSGTPKIAESPAEILEPLITIAFDDALPTVWAYQRALSRSPSDLDALLDKHASLAAHATPTPNHHLFIRSNRDLLLPGEL